MRLDRGPRSRPNQAWALRQFGRGSGTLLQPPRYAALHLVVREQLRGRVLEHDAAGLEHVAAAARSTAPCARSARRAGWSCRARLISTMVWKISRTSSGASPSDGSSSSSSARPRHQRAADRQHLLLAARERARRSGGGARAGAGTARNTCVAVLLDPGAVLAPVGAELEVVLDRQVREHHAALGRVRRCRAPTISCARHARDVAALERDRAPRAPGTRPEIVRSSVVLPAPLAPISVTISPASARSDDALQRVDRAVVDVEVLDLEQHVTRPPRGRRRPPRRGRPRSPSGRRGSRPGVPSAILTP